jgi:predicted O-methyltransferase YrrM
LKYFLGTEPACTQTTAGERALLADYASRSRRLLEIGVFEAVTTRTMASAMPDDAELFGVDPFFKGRLGISWGKVIASRELKKVKGKRIKLVEALSEEAASLIDGEFDFIFIDADHSLAGIQKDWEVWSPRCAVGGVIAFHDTRTAPHAPYVQDFGSFRYYNDVIRRAIDYKEIDSIDTTSIVRRVS